MEAGARESVRRKEGGPGGPCPVARRSKALFTSSCPASNHSAQARLRARPGGICKQRSVKFTPSSPARSHHHAQAWRPRTLGGGKSSSHPAVLMLRQHKLSLLSVYKPRLHVAFPHGFYTWRVHAESHVYAGMRQQCKDATGVRGWLSGV